MFLPIKEFKLQADNQLKIMRIKIEEVPFTTIKDKVITKTVANIFFKGNKVQVMFEMNLTLEDLQEVP